MVRFLLRLLLLAASISLVSLLVPGVHIRDWKALLLAALVVGMANALLRPLLIFFTLPLVLVSLGLFILVINAGLLYLAAWIVPGFALDGFGWAFVAALLISAVSFVLNRLVLGPQGRNR